MSDDSRDRITPAAPTFQASRALLSAALGGLLCVAPACSSSGDAQPVAATDSGSASDTGGTKDTATATDGAGASDTEGSPAVDAFDTSAPDVADAAAEAASDGGAGSDAATGDAVVFCPAEAGVITSSTIDASMTLAKFTALCDMRHGTLQIHPHCGGYNSCKGISYDSGTQVFTEHSCKGLNTCTGYSCVDPC